MKNLIKQFLKFGIVGVINTVSSWIIYYSLIAININYLIATTVGYILSSILGYMLNNLWVFKYKSKKKMDGSILRYYAVYISSYLINLGCMYLLVDIMNISDKIAPILVLCVTVPYNFVFSKLWIFSQKRKSIDYDNLEKMAKEKHTFAICAYKDSEYLEDCIKSIINQKVKSNCIIATSTPSEFIENLANKYKLEYFVRHGSSDIQEDWNFAVDNVRTELVTVAHQDDIYEENYVEELMKNYDEEGIIYITDYYPFKNNEKTVDRNSKIKKRAKIFLKNRELSKIKLFKRLAISFGNSICCPSVAYSKKIINETIFTSDLKFGLDWDTYLKFTEKEGRFVYIPKKLINYRIHDGATTKEFIINNKRYEEDIIMFNKFWPQWVTKIIMKYYIKSYETY